MSSLLEQCVWDVTLIRHIYEEQMDSFNCSVGMQLERLILAAAEGKAYCPFKDLIDGECKSFSLKRREEKCNWILHVCVLIVSLGKRNWPVHLYESDFYKAEIMGSIL